MNRKRPSFKRWHPLLAEWVIYAPATAVRPWNGALVDQAIANKLSFDPGCYLCPGVTRAGGGKNPDYTGTHVFDNDFPSLAMEYGSDVIGQSGSDISARGRCRVVCFSPRHDLTLAEMPLKSIEGVVKTFREEYGSLSSTAGISYVMPFENKGAVIGVSNSHPHGQIYATDFVPRIPETMYRSAERFHRESGQCLFCNILKNELSDGSGIICQNDTAVAFVPSFARHAFETMILPRRHFTSLNEMTDDDLGGFAECYREMLVRYDNLFSLSFPNITLFYNAPCVDEYDPAPFHFHISFCPPMRNRDTLKYMAGFETGGGNIINPSIPAESAAALRSVGAVHYSERAK